MIKCKILKRGFIKQENYTTFTTTLAQSIPLIKITNEQDINNKYFSHDGEPVIVYVKASDYSLNESELILNNILVCARYNDDFVGLINLYNELEGTLKEKVGQLGVTFIVSLLPPPIKQSVNIAEYRATDLYKLDKTQTENQFNEDF